MVVTLVRPAPGRAGTRLVAAHALTATATSMPWPVLLAAVWSQTHDEAWLGVVGASRMAPYVVLSAAAGMLADRASRTTVIRWSAGLRAVTLLGCASALVTGHLGPAVVCAVVTVVLGTPAYPAGVAALPGVAGARTERLTPLLVTVEVTAFVVGPALSGVLIGLELGPAAVWAASGLAVLALPLLRGLRSEPAADRPAYAPGRLRTVFASPGVSTAIGLVALVNFVESAASVLLVSLSADRWHAGERGFGVGTAALGFGALAAPLVLRVVRLRGSLLGTAAGCAGAGLAPATAIAVTPLAVLGAASTAVECLSTETLQQAVPDRVQAFALGLTDSIMVGAAMLGALVAPAVGSALGPSGGFVAAALLVVLLGGASVARRPGGQPVGGRVGR